MRKRRHDRSAAARAWIAGLVVAGLAVGAGVLTMSALRPAPAPTGVAEYTPTPVPVDTTPVIPTVVFIGDSFVGGSDMGGQGAANWSARAAKMLGWGACTFAVGGSGWSAGQNDWTYASRAEWALSVAPSAVVFANGVGDLTSALDVSLNAASGAIDTIVSQSPATKVIVVGIAKVRDEQSPAVDKFNSQMREVVEARGGIYIDPTAEGWFDGEHRALLGDDRFHPTDDGHSYYADRFVADIKSANVSLALTPRNEKKYCTIPKWGQQRPDGTIVTPSPTPQATGN